MRRFSFLLTGAWLLAAGLLHAADRPNILWITSEDNGPQLGAYGDPNAVTPHLDGLAARSLIYLNAWSTAPVCAPARTTLISGMYPPSTGSQHMRSQTFLPEGMLMYPAYLRQLGYHCTNNSKEDYNLQKAGEVWDDSSRKGHWRSRKPGQPFFSVFNFTISHESQIRNKIDAKDQIHDPAKIRVPAYHPDTPETRRDWAQYYDRITMMDAQVGQVLKQLEEDGLTEDTIIYYYGDHGSGMPRSKRWPYNSGLNVPLIIHVPQKYAHLAPRHYQAGGKSSELVGFIDLAPTVLSVAGMKPPAQMQGVAFMGSYQAPEREFNFGFRGRMDERYDMVRVARDQRYIYIRNYMPHRIYGQFIDYMFQTPTTRIWKEMYDAGKLNEVQGRFWETKPAEELYDLQADPDEVNNLAGDPAHEKVLARLRKAQRGLAMEIRDLGFLPEGEIHARAGSDAPRTMGLDNQRYAIGRIMKTAEDASSLKPEATPGLVKALNSPDSAVRYWAASGLLMRSADAVNPHAAALRKALQDDSPYVRIVAAEALGRFGSDQDARKAGEVLIALAPADTQGVYVSMMALTAIDYMDQRAAFLRDAIAKVETKDPKADGRMKAYVPNLVKKILADLDAAR